MRELGWQLESQHLFIALGSHRLEGGAVAIDVSFDGSRSGQPNTTTTIDPSCQAVIAYYGH